MKKLLSIVLCVLFAGTALIVPANALDTTESGFCGGSMVQCGKYIVSAVNNVKKSKLRIYRTSLKGKKKKLVATTPTYPGTALLTYKDKVYYRKGTAVIAYAPSTGKKSKQFDMAYGLHKASKKDSISMLAVCPQGIVYRDALSAIYLRGFDGSDNMVADSAASKFNSHNTFLGATEDSIFYYKTEKKSGSRYVQQMYRYIYSDLTVQKTGSFNSVKKPYNVPSDGSFCVVGDKLIFTVGGIGKSGQFEGVLCSMNKDGSGVKTLKEGAVGPVIFPAKSGAYITLTDKKGNTGLTKISDKGKLTQAVKYTDIKYPIITYTTPSGCAVGINHSKTEFSYDLYALPKVKKTVGKMVIKAGNLLKKTDYGYILVTPTIGGSVGDLVLVTYGVYRYDNKGDFEKVYRCQSYIVNAKTGKKTLIDK